jgi:hypothetical protein
MSPILRAAGGDWFDPGCLSRAVAGRMIEPSDAIGALGELLAPRLLRDLATCWIEMTGLPPGPHPLIRP